MINFHKYQDEDEDENNLCCICGFSSFTVRLQTCDTCLKKTFVKCLHCTRFFCPDCKFGTRSGEKLETRFFFKYLPMNQVLPETISASSGTVLNKTVASETPVLASSVVASTASTNLSNTTITDDTEGATKAKKRKTSDENLRTCFVCAVKFLGENPKKHWKTQKHTQALTESTLEAKFCALECNRRKQPNRTYITKDAQLEINKIPEPRSHKTCLICGGIILEASS